MSNGTSLKLKEEKPHYLGHRKRMREKLLKFGSSAFADYEILEMLLFSSIPRDDVRPLAKKLLNNFGSLSKILSASQNELKSIDGVGDAVIANIRVVQEILVRSLRDDIEKKVVISSWKALLDYCRATMIHSKTEQFRIFFLDTKNQLIADEQQQQGTIDHTPVYPREIVKRALELGALSIILAHNHPSGDPSPSKMDIDVTRKIIEAAKPLGVQVHDHIIIGGNKHYSFKTNGLI